MTEELKKELTRWVKLADKFDRSGNYAEADKIDQKIGDAMSADEEFLLEIPQDEKTMLDEVMKSLQESLQ